MPSPRIPKPKPPFAAKSIPRPNPSALPDTLVFSFKHLDLTGHPKFSVDECEDGYLAHFLERLKSLSALSVAEIRSNKSKSIRAHRIDWTETSERGGIAYLNEELRQEESWQFQITANAHGRVHGLLIHQTFYVVWIDPRHRLYL